MKLKFSGILHLIIVYQRAEREKNSRGAVVQTPAAALEYPRARHCEIAFPFAVCLFGPVCGKGVKMPSKRVTPAVWDKALSGKGFQRSGRAHKQADKRVSVERGRL